MVQITPSNLLNTTESGRILPQTSGGVAGLQSAQMVSQAVDRAAGVLEKISQTAEDMEVNKKLTSAQVAFAKSFEERANMLELPDGTPASETLDSDLVKLGRDIQNEFGAGISSARGRDKFGMLFNNFTANKRIQGFGIARTQKLERATGDFYDSLDNLTNQASNPTNADLAPSFIKQADALIDDAIRDGIISSTQGVKFKKGFSEGTHESLIRQSIDVDPLSALAVLSDSDEDLGVSPTTRIALKKLAKQTLQTLRTNKSTMATQKSNAHKMNMESIELGVKDIINNSPIDGMEGGFTRSDMESVFASIDNLSIIHSQEEIDAELDPVVQASMRADNVTAAQYGQNRKAEIKNKYDDRNKQARIDADRVRKIQKDQRNGLSTSPEDAKFMYRTQTAGQSMGTKMQVATKLRQPQPTLQNEFTTAVSAGNIEALSDSVDSDGNVEPGVISAFVRLSEESPAVLKGMGETNIAKLTYLSRLVGSGTPVKAASDLIREKFDTINSVERDIHRNDYRKPDTGADIRDHIMDRVINKVAGLTSGPSDATPQFRENVTILGELMYQIHGDKDAAADAVALMMQDAGSTEFPVKSQGFFSNNQEVMTATPEKVMGWTPEESRIAISKFQEEFSTVAGVNGIDTDTMYIESDRATVRPGQPRTWAVWGVTDNGQHVSLGRYKPSTKEELVQHNLHRSYATTDDKNKQLKDFRKRFGVDEGGLLTPKTPQDKKNTDIQRLQRFKESAKRSIIKSRVDSVAGGGTSATLPPDATLPEVASVIVRDIQDFGNEVVATHGDINEFVEEWNQKIWETVIPKTAYFLNKYFFNPIAGDAKGSEPTLDETMKQFGAVAVESPEKAQEIFADAQLEEEDQTEAEPSSIDGSINTTGLSPSEVEDRKQARLMEDTRHLTAASDPLFHNKKDESEFNAAIKLMHENVSAPEQVFPHEAALAHIESKPEKMLTGKEAYYLRQAKLREEKFDTSTPPSDSLIPKNLLTKIQSDPLLNRVYESEQYRPRAYDDGLGNITVGIGWNLDGDDTSNRSTVNWLNTVSTGGKQYNLESLRAGKQTLSPNDAVLVLQRQVKSAGFEAGQVMGRGMFHMSTAQQRVANDMSFQLGIGTFKKFKSFLRHVKHNDMMKAPIEIINSTAGTSQTPQRFANHYVDFVMGGRYTAEQRAQLKAEAIKFYKSKKITNVSGNNFRKEVISIITNGIK